MSVFCVFLFVVVQRASVPWFLQWAKVDGKYPFSSNSIVVSVAFVEILLGVGIACANRGLLRGVKETLNPRELRKWFLLGLSQALGDMLELYANRYLDASTYQVLLQSKLLVTALLMALVTHRGVTQSSLEWLLLTTLSLGLTTYSILSNGSGCFSPLGTMLAVMKVILSCSNAVFTERILKQSQGTPLVHQIVHMKVFWCFWSIVCMALLEGPEVYAPARFFDGWGWSVLVVMVTYVVKNWSGTFLLKRLDSLLKNIAEAFAMLVLYLLEISPIFGKQKALQLPTFCVTMMVVLLVWAYLESKKKTSEQSTGKHMSFTEFLGRPLDSDGWRGGRRLGRKYGLLPYHSVRKLPSSCRLVANKNALPAAQCRMPSDAMPPPLDLEEVPWGPDAQAPSSVPGQPDFGEAPWGPAAEVPSSVPGQTFSVVDTLQELLRCALDCQQGDGGWQASVTRALSMCTGLRPYLEAQSSKASPECQAIADATHATDWPELYRAGHTLHLYHARMMTSPVQSQMLGFFGSMLSARRVLEVGMFTGFSTLCMAEATRGKVIAVERDPYLVQMAKKSFEGSPHGHKIEIVCGDALQVIRDMGVAGDEESRFDMIFIDGEKTQYVQYFQLINDLDLLAPGGLICIDDTLWKGSIYGCGREGDEGAGARGQNNHQVTEAMRELNYAIASDPRFVSVLLPISNGLTLVRRLDRQASAEPAEPPWQRRLRAASLAPGAFPATRPLQRRGVSQEGLAPVQTTRPGGRRPPPAGRPPQQQPEQAHTAEPILEGVREEDHRQGWHPFADGRACRQESEESAAWEFQWQPAGTQRLMTC